VIHTQQDTFRLMRALKCAPSVACGLFLLVILLASKYSFASVVDNSKFCLAPDNYLAAVEQAQAADLADLDFSCLTTLPSISSNLSAYQLVDVRRHDGAAPSIAGAWQMPVAHLKTKSFLKNRPLLLIDEGFSRVGAASDCQLLRKAGFKNIKILMGGVDTWQSYENTPRSRVNATTQPNRVVSAQQILYEYSNHKVLLITGSKEVSSSLALLGLDNHILIESITAEKIVKTVVAESENGFVPTVIIDDTYLLDVNLTRRLPNLYTLPGGVVELSHQVQKNIQTNRGRTAASERFFCANS
jgi:rhodanese-related sulfurtransferase